MRRFHLMGIIIVASSLLAGCAEMQYGMNSFNTLRLQVGMSRDEVIATMGKPQIRESYGKTEFLIYRTDFPASSGTADFTPVAIMNGKVTGWGRDFYDETRKKRVQVSANKKQQSGPENPQ
jgi:major membrane immunogen (membrane-anchored lipoprotein)